MCRRHLDCLEPKVDLLFSEDNHAADDHAAGAVATGESTGGDLEYSAEAGGEIEQSPDAHADGDDLVHHDDDDPGHHEVTGDDAHALEDENDYEGSGVGTDNIGASEAEGADDLHLDTDDIHQNNSAGDVDETGGEHTEYEEYTEYNEDYDERYGEDLSEQNGEATYGDSRDDFNGDESDVEDGELTEKVAWEDEALPALAPTALVSSLSVNSSLSVSALEDPNAGAYDATSYGTGYRRLVDRLRINQTH